MEMENTVDDSYYITKNYILLCVFFQYQYPTVH